MNRRVDLGERRVKVSVGELSSAGLQRSIGLGGRGLSRLWMGQELHQRVQEELSRDEIGFEAELPLKTELESGGWILEISGRADGVLFSNGSPLRVDEIKTLHFAVDLNGLYVEERLEPFRRQLRIYAWMLRQNFGIEAEARLILVDIVSGERRFDEVGWKPEAVEADLRKYLHRHRSREEAWMAERKNLRKVAESIPFPHAGIRPIQEEISEEVRGALDAGETLLLQAPTGTGKTAAVLHPTIRWAFGHRKRVCFLTAKTLQQKLAVETLRKMQDSKAFRSLQLRAKSKMCANEEMVCHEEYCAWAREYGLKLLRTGIIRELKENHVHQDPDLIYERAFQSEICPFELSLELLSDSNVLVCDYNYVFDPSIGIDALIGEGALQDTVLIIDEAHNLVQRSREYYSPELLRRDVNRALAALSTRDNKVYRRLGKLAEALGEVIGATVNSALGEKGRGEELTAFDQEVLSTLRMDFDAAILEYFLYKRERELWSAQDPVVELFVALVRFQRVLSLGGAEFVHLARKNRQEGESLKIFCRDASRFCGKLISESAGVVAMSATMEPFDFYRNLLGIVSGRERSFDSPFPRQNRLIVNIPDIDTTWKGRPRFHDAVAAWISKLAPKEGNALVLFPSYAYLNDVADRLDLLLLESGSPAPWVLTRQLPGLADEGQGEVLKALEMRQPQMVLAVLGGIFAEGVDYPGSMLSEVIIVSPALPQFNREQELLKEYFEECYGHGFSYAYLIPGMTRVIQAAGRLIRSAEDRGVIVLVGRRFQQGRHARFLPRDWIGDDPSNILQEDPVFAVHRFFED